VFEKLKRWTLEEKIFKLVLPQKKDVEWAFELSYPFKHPAPMNVLILNPSGRDMIIIQIGIKMSPQHLAVMKEKGPVAFQLFYHGLKKLFLQKDVLYRIDQANHTWVASVQIYFDGLTKHNFFSSIQRLYNAIILGNLLIEEIIQMKIVKTKSSALKMKGEDKTSSNFYS